jgi:hypothetical protein
MGTVHFCVGDNYSGACKDILLYNTNCKNVPDGYNDNINSFRITARTIVCTLFEYVNFPVTAEKPTT